MIHRIVLDASAALEATLGGPRADVVADTLEQASVVLVPGISHSEVANALWKYVRAGPLELQDAVERFETATSLAATALSQT